MSKEITTITKSVSHPLEDVLDIEPNSTIITRQEQKTELVVHDDYDRKDESIDAAIQEVYDKAMSGYERIQDECEDIEPRYLPRMMEVGVQHLKAALDAAQVKARIKESKDKISAKAKSTGPKTVNQNLIVSREDLLKMLDGDSEEEPKA